MQFVQKVEAYKENIFVEKTCENIQNSSIDTEMLLEKSYEVAIDKEIPLNFVN